MDGHSELSRLQRELGSRADTEPPHGAPTDPPTRFGGSGGSWSPTQFAERLVGHLRAALGQSGLAPMLTTEKAWRALRTFEAGVTARVLEDLRAIDPQQPPQSSFADRIAEIYEDARSLLGTAARHNKTLRALLDSADAALKMPVHSHPIGALHAQGAFERLESLRSLIRNEIGPLVAEWLPPEKHSDPEALVAQLVARHKTARELLGANVDAMTEAVQVLNLHMIELESAESQLQRVFQRAAAKWFARSTPCSPVEVEQWRKSVGSWGAPDPESRAKASKIPCPECCFALFTSYDCPTCHGTGWQP